MKENESPIDDIKIGQLSSQWGKARGIPTTFTRETKSTNLFAKEKSFELVQSDKPFHLIVTDSQTQGRGRGQNTWTTPPSGSALLSSWCFLTENKPQGTFACRVGMALYRAAMTTWPFLDWSLKAPNDLLLEGSKIAGILIESVSQGNQTLCIVGIGMNVLSTPENLPDATDILSVLPDEAPLLGDDWVMFLDRLITELSEAVGLCQEQLSSTDQLSLRAMLNANPNLSEQIKKVYPDGSLETAQKKIPWMSL